MYERFYGFSELPFELTANPKYLFLSSRHREALSTLQYGLFAAKSITLLIGEAGTGKTTLIRAALESERCQHVRCIYLNNPALRPEDFLRLLAIKFKLGSDAAQSKAVLLEQLEKALRERRDAGEITALVIDEAQSLSIELLEEVRLLANIETPSTKLLPLILAGQPELADRLENHDLRQLRQRVTLRCHLEPFTMNETAAFISSRLTVAGGVPSRVFTKDAVMLIHEYSRGIPRTISVICDNALVSGMALDRQPVTRTIVAEVCRDFRLTTSTGHNAPTPAHQPPEPSAEPSDEAAADGSVDTAAEPGRPFGFFRRNRSRLGGALAHRSDRMITHEPN